MRAQRNPGSWDLDKVPLEDVDRAAMQSRRDLFYLVNAASFVEIAADLYTHNLISYFGNDAEISGWLEGQWQHEEIRHGRVLRDYVRHVWPDFDWDRAYAGFFADYSQQCTVEAFESTAGLELVARCVVETGTSTYYESLAAQADEPVLRGIALRIRADEINHYKHFYRYFRRYQQHEKQGRLAVLQSIARRVAEARNGDADCALRHVHAAEDPHADPDACTKLYAQFAANLRHDYPLDMAIKMILKPLDFPAALNRAIRLPLVWAGKRWLLN